MKLDAITESLKNIGIDVENQSTEVVLNKLKSKWHTLDRDTKFEISKQAAGRLGMSQFMLMMEVKEND